MIMIFHFESFFRSVSLLLYIYTDVLYGSVPQIHCVPFLFQVCIQRGEQMASKIQIEMDLFKDLVIYAYRHEEPDDMQYLRFMDGIRSKLEALKRSELYTQYVSGTSQEIRSSARNSYLELIGCFDDFRWPDSMDVHVSRSRDALFNDVS